MSSEDTSHSKEVLKPKKKHCWSFGMIWNFLRYTVHMQHRRLREMRQNATGRSVTFQYHLSEEALIVMFLGTQHLRRPNYHGFRGIIIL